MAKAEVNSQKEIDDAQGRIQAIWDKAWKEERSLTPDEGREIDGLEEKIRRLKGQISLSRW